MCTDYGLRLCTKYTGTVVVRRLHSTSLLISDQLIIQLVLAAFACIRCAAAVRVQSILWTRVRKHIYILLVIVPQGMQSILLYISLHVLYSYNQYYIICGNTSSCCSQQKQQNFELRV